MGGRWVAPYGLTGRNSSGRGHCWCLQLHGHWLQHLFEWKQNRDRVGQTNEMAQPPTIGLSKKDVPITHSRTPYNKKGMIMIKIILLEIFWH